LNGAAGTVRQQQNDISIVRSAQQRAGPGLGRRLEGRHPQGPAGDLQRRPHQQHRARRLFPIRRWQLFPEFAARHWQRDGAGPADTERPQQPATAGYDLRRARLRLTGSYARDWQFDFVEEFGNLNAAGVTQTGAGAANPAPGGAAISGQMLTASLTYNGVKSVALVAGYTDVFDTFGAAVSSVDISFNERAAIINLVTNLAGNEPPATFGLLGSGERWYGEGWVTGPQNTIPTNGQQAAVAARAGLLPYNTADSFLTVGGKGSYVFIPPHNDAASGISSNGVSPAGETASSSPRVPSSASIPPTRLLPAPSTPRMPARTASSWRALGRAYGSLVRLTASWSTRWKPIGRRRSRRPVSVSLATTARSVISSPARSGLTVPRAAHGPRSIPFDRCLSPATAGAPSRSPGDTASPI